MNIIVLSLDSEIGKKRRSKLNYDYELFTGNTELDKCENWIVTKMNRMHNIKDNLFRIKCCHFDSMVLILKKIVKEKLNNVIVCEDDAILKEHIYDIFKNHNEPILKPVLLNCRLIHPTTYKSNTLTYRRENIIPLVKQFTNGINNFDYNSYRWACCACIYYPSYQSAQKLLDFIYEQDKITTFDLFLSKHKYITELYYPSVFSIEDEHVSQVDKPCGIINNYLKKNEN